MRQLRLATTSGLVYINRNHAFAVPDYEDVPDPEERDHPTPLKEGSPGTNLPPIPDRGFPGEDERVLEDVLKY
ncbi:hypothetical protein M8998_03560 [Sphingobacterium sp. lm-10]|uniref:hypothetical protein n=1 Tax=Sphingobacterium sp. lm-10 TaxID=2944904 RepID=UPI0020225D28|nr:hypothetical protein [Sphingobacterium sp. lm-10]MCL7987015.1 hypothetical protein [Sphingobacterium sp. lm-10]